MDIRYENLPGLPPSVCIDGESFVEAAAYKKIMSENVQLVEQLREKQRSEASHAHQFAELRSLWESLPEALANAPYAKSFDHLRKHALIATGFCDTDIIDCGDHQIAVAAAPLIAKNARKAYGYAIITVRGSLITCSTPQSQSYKEMGKDRFEDSKNKTLDWCHHLIGSQR